MRKNKCLNQTNKWETTVWHRNRSPVLSKRLESLKVPILWIRSTQTLWPDFIIKICFRARIRTWGHILFTTWLWAWARKMLFSLFWRGRWLRLSPFLLKSISLVIRVLLIRPTRCSAITRLPNKIESLESTSLSTPSRMSRKCPGKKRPHGTAKSQTGLVG